MCKTALGCATIFWVYLVQNFTEAFPRRSSATAGENHADVAQDAVRESQL
jgi:hypothetical protein